MVHLAAKECELCGREASPRYNPMEEWNMEGPLCGDCYSKRISEHYPGEHARVNND